MAYENVDDLQKRQNCWYHTLSCCGCCCRTTCACNDMADIVLIGGVCCYLLLLRYMLFVVLIICFVCFVFVLFLYNAGWQSSRWMETCTNTKCNQIIQRSNKNCSRYTKRFVKVIMKNGISVLIIFRFVVVVCCVKI